MLPLMKKNRSLNKRLDVTATVLSFELLHKNHEDVWMHLGAEKIV